MKNTCTKSIRYVRTMSCSTEADSALRSANGGTSWWNHPSIFVINYPQGAACARWIFQLLNIFDHALVRVGGVQINYTSICFFLVDGGQKVWLLHFLIPSGIVILSFQSWTQHEWRFYHIRKFSSCSVSGLLGLIVRLLNGLQGFRRPYVAESLTIWSLQGTCGAKLLTQNFLTMRSERTRDLREVKEHHSATFSCLGPCLSACFF